MEVADHVEANIDFAKLSMEYYRTLEKKGHGGKDFGYVFQYVMKNLQA